MPWSPVNPNAAGTSFGQFYQGVDGNWYYSDGRPYVNAAPRPGVNPGQRYPNEGQPYRAADGNWYYPDGRPYTATAVPQPAGTANQPYLATDGNWYYPDGRLYQAAQPAAPTGQPYLAVDGKWYYPDGRPYTAEAATQPAAPSSTAATSSTATPSTPAAPERLPATPAPNMIPAPERSDAVARNLVRTRLAAVPSSVRETLVQELPHAIQEQLNQLENELRPVLFSNADETALLALYKKSFTEDTAQYELARKIIRSLEADELAQRLSIDQVAEARLPLYVGKLRMSAKLKTLRNTILEGRTGAEPGQTEKDLLATYQQVAGDAEFASLKLPGQDPFHAKLTPLHSLLELRQKLAGMQAAAKDSLVTMAKHFWIVSYPGLPKDTMYAIDSEICLRGTGTGTIGVRDAGLPDLGVPLLNRAAEPLPEVPTPPASSGAIVYNSSTSPAPVHYVADNESYELNPGESRAHKVTAKSRISYNRGGDLGNQEYQLGTGTFRFAIADRAWQLTKPTVGVLLDNSANGLDFQCNIDGQSRVIPARTTLDVKSIYPIAIRFDRGEGQSASSKLINESSQATVGVRPDSTTIDLFPGTSQELCAQPQAPPNSIVSLPKS